MEKPRRVEDLIFAVEPCGGIMDSCSHGNPASFIATVRFRGKPCNVVVPACKIEAECPELAEEKAKKLAAELLAKNQLVVYSRYCGEGIWRT